MVQRRGSGSGAGSSKSRERGDRERDRLRSRERNEARIALADEARRVAGEVESEEKRKEGEGRKAAMLRVLSPPTVIGSAGEGSDWESATDSPRPVTKALPGTSLRVESGLGKAMGGELDANQLKVAPQDVEREVSPSRPTGRATFQLVDDDELSSTPPDTPTHLAPSQGDRIARRPPPHAQLPLRQATPPPTPPQQHVTPPPPVAAPSAPQQSTIAFPTSSGPPSPQAPAKYRPRQARKSSNASLASIASTRSLAASFHGLMGPPSPAFRRTASSLAPTVDRGTVATGHVFESTGMGHRRNGSMSSLRSLRSVVEAAEAGPSGMGERRTSTMGANEGRQAVRRLKLANLSAGSDAGGAGTVGGGAAAALASLGGTRPAPAKRSASGYFATLRGLANIPGLTPPSPAPSPPPTRLSMPPPTSTNPTATLKPRVSPRMSQPVISKFIEPTPNSAYSSSPSHLSSVSPVRTRGPLFARQSQQGSSSTASLGAMSRTQQKALLARDAPYWSNGSSTGGSGIADPIASGSAGYYSQFPTLPLSISTKPRSGEEKARADGMQKWAMGLVREAERIERQYRSVGKWRDPLGESLERVLPKMSVKKVR